MGWGRKDKQERTVRRVGWPEGANFFLDPTKKSLEGFSSAVGTSPEKLQALRQEFSNRFVLAKAQDFWGFPHVAVETATRTLEETATHCHRNFQSWGEALQQSSARYHKTLQKTATNCQQNVAQLGDILQQSFPWESLHQAAITGAGGLFNPGTPKDVITLPQTLARQLGMEAASQGASQLEELYAKEWAKPHKQKNRRKSNLRNSSLREPGRMLAIVTTACLPWMTGTSVNPLLRAVYLANSSERKVTLVVPWLSKVDQAKVFPNGLVFDTPEHQEEYVRTWVEKRTGLKSSFKLTFYPGRYAPEKCSILPVGDLTQCIPDHEADVAVLEEPEHLNWYHHGNRWTDKFNHVVGIMHTNYLDYARREENGEVKENILHRVNQWVTRVHCHHVVKLSGAVQALPRQKIEFVHGVSPAFLEKGKRRSESPPPGESREGFRKGVYFIGKVLWAKGYTELVDLLSKHSQSRNSNLKVDVYGSGQDSIEVQQEAAKRNLDMSFFGARDHVDSSIDDYKVFVNPSTSDVVATTTAEALAMGKFVVCADHPSNRFFSNFRNCLIYKTPEEFSRCMETALTSQPQPLSKEEQRNLTWEAATERFLTITELPRCERPKGLEAAVDKMCWALHNSLTGVEPLRVIAGAGARTKDTPQRVVDYIPVDGEGGGILDRKKTSK